MFCFLRLGGVLHGFNALIYCDAASGGVTTHGWRSRLIRHRTFFVLSYGDWLFSYVCGTPGIKATAGMAGCLYLRMRWWREMHLGGLFLICFLPIYLSVYCQLVSTAYLSAQCLFLYLCFALALETISWFVPIGQD